MLSVRVLRTLCTCLSLKLLVNSFYFELVKRINIFYVFIDGRVCGWIN